MDQGAMEESSCADGGSVMFWAMFCWETFRLTNLVAVISKYTTYLNIVADDVHLFIETAFPDGVANTSSRC